MIARLVRSADFERVLRTRTRVHTLHFAVHHLTGWPMAPAEPAARAVTDELSTTHVPSSPPSVDDSAPKAPPAALGARWLGAVVPKRHARRSVTRSLLKRQIRAVVTGHSDALAVGLWVVRLRAPFDHGRFVSAASDELKREARAELELLIRRATQPVVGR